MGGEVDALVERGVPVDELTTAEAVRLTQREQIKAKKLWRRCGVDCFGRFFLAVEGAEPDAERQH